VTLWAVRAINPGNIPRLDDVRLDGRVLAFTMAISALTGIVFGLAPALRLRRIDLNTALKAGGRSGQTDGGGLASSRHGLRGLLVVAEVALSLMLLVGAGLLVRSFAVLSDVSPGFDPNHVLSMAVTLSGTDLRQPVQRGQFFERMIGAIEQMPGVRAAGATSVLPFTASISWGGLTVEGYTPPADQPELQVDQRVVTPHYFTAIGVPLKDGRWFSAGDGPDTTPVVIVDEKMARHFWPHESPIGKRVKQGGPDSKNPWVTIVGVAGTVKQYGLEIDGRMVAYYPHKQQQAGGMYVVARTDGDPLAASAGIVRVIRAVDARVTTYGIASMDERVFQSLARQRFAMIMLTAFALFALLLAAVGIYGVMSYIVSQGTRDIGIRMALGAERTTILSMIVGQGMTLTGIGVVAGLAGAFALTRFMASLLFGVSASDAATLSSVAVLLGVVALAASYIPAQRATRVDPIVALRDE
jgi:predicted permease